METVLANTQIAVNVCPILNLTGKAWKVLKCDLRLVNLINANNSFTGIMYVATIQ